MISRYLLAIWAVKMCENKGAVKCRWVLTYTPGLRGLLSGLYQSLLGDGDGKKNTRKCQPCLRILPWWPLELLLYSSSITTNFECPWKPWLVWSTKMRHSLFRSLQICETPEQSLRSQKRITFHVLSAWCWRISSMMFLQLTFANEVWKNQKSNIQHLAFRI